MWKKFQILLDKLFSRKYNEYEIEISFTFCRYNVLRQREEGETMPLVYAPANTELKIVRVAADEKTKKHLESLGISGGGEIMVLSSGAGSVVCKVKEGRIALDGNVSAKVFVSVANKGEEVWRTYIAGYCVLLAFCLGYVRLCMRPSANPLTPGCRASVFQTNFW